MMECLPRAGPYNETVRLRCTAGTESYVHEKKKSCEKNTKSFMYIIMSYDGCDVILRYVP